MNLTIDNGWRGAVPGIAAMAALSVRADGSAVLVMKVADAVADVPPGTLFTADGSVWRIAGPASAPRGLLSYICTKEA